MAQCPTCCVQPARREEREDGADSGDADEDEGAEGAGGLLCLVFERCGEDPVDASKDRSSCYGYGSTAELQGLKVRGVGRRAEVVGRCGGGRCGGGAKPGWSIGL
eukprot:scaffold30850_cov73-Phaeocystis_antarctica.AAC.11